MRQTMLVLFLLYPLSVLSDSNITRERVTCYQDGQQILNLGDQASEFRHSGELKQVAEIKLRQVGGDRVRIYAVDTGNLVCIHRTPG